MRCTWFAAITGCLLLSIRTEAKIFTHCELAQELRRLQISESQIATWICIAHYESRLNTSAISGTGDHGIFQISEEYWCSPPGRGKGCGLTCAELEDDNIDNDVECIQTIFDEHQHLSGNGFNAWAVYPRCKTPSNVNRFIKKCTLGSIDNSIDTNDPPLDLRFGSPSYSSAPQNSYSSKPSYIPYNPKPSYNPIQDFSFTKTSDSPLSQDYSFTKTSASPLQDFSYSPNQDVSSTRASASPVSRDYSFKSIFSPRQDVSFTRASASHLTQGYDYEPFSYSTRRPTQFISSSTLVPSTILSYNPSIYSSTRPSSYSVGSIYYNPFETAAPAAVYSFNPRKSFSSSSFDSRRTLSGYTSTSAPQLYKTYTTSDAAVIKTSSPAPPLKFKAPWADFPWWNGGK